MVRLVAQTHCRCEAVEDAFLRQGGHVAVLLNGNAKQVNDRVRRQLSSVLPDEHLFFSRSHEEANEIAEEVISRRYGTVFTGGGDGTFVSWVNRILDRAEHRAAHPPRFGVLALGTGNAVAEMVGARASRPAEDLARYVRGEVGAYRQLELLTCGGRRTPFAGVGVDAAVLNDYNWMKDHLAYTPLHRLSLGASGYGFAVALRSGPRFLRERRAYGEVVNIGRPAWRLDRAGRRIGRPIPHGELLYAGPCMMAAGSTVPYYGFGLRAFPFAEQAPGMMQLRIASEIPVPTLLVNLARIWRGDFSHPGLLDFHADRVHLRFEREMPLQIGGDAEGWRDELTLGMASGSVEIVDFGTRAAA